MPITHSKLQELLMNVFLDDDVQIKDLVGDNNHYEVSITSEKFRGLSLVKQHKLVMDALGDRVGGEIHALSVKTIVK